MKLVLVSFTLFYSATCAFNNIFSHFTLMFARGTCASCSSRIVSAATVKSFLVSGGKTLSAGNSPHHRAKGAQKELILHCDWL